MIDCDRHWLLTWTTYGTWLPGDERGFVSALRGPEGRQVIHNAVGTDFDRDLPTLRESTRQRMRSPPLFLDTVHVPVLLSQWLNHAAFRGHQLEAAAAMANHCHLVVGVMGDPSPSRLLGDYKSYSSRALNECFGIPAGKSWWTQSGSKRKLPPHGVNAAVEYVRRQHRPLLVWAAAHWI